MSTKEFKADKFFDLSVELNLLLLNSYGIEREFQKSMLNIEKHMKIKNIDVTYKKGPLKTLARCQEKV